MAEDLLAKSAIIQHYSMETKSGMSKITFLLHENYRLRCFYCNSHCSVLNYYGILLCIVFVTCHCCMPVNCFVFQIE